MPLLIAGSTIRLGGDLDYTLHGIFSAPALSFTLPDSILSEGIDWSEYVTSTAPIAPIARAYCNAVIPFELDRGGHRFIGHSPASREIETLVAPVAEMG